MTCFKRTIDEVRHSSEIRLGCEEAHEAGVGINECSQGWPAASSKGGGRWRVGYGVNTSGLVHRCIFGWCDVVRRIDDQHGNHCDGIININRTNCREKWKYKPSLGLESIHVLTSLIIRLTSIHECNDQTHLCLDSLRAYHHCRATEKMRLQFKVARAKGYIHRSYDIVEWRH